MLSLLGRTLFWVVIGLIGTFSIFLFASYAIESQVPIKIVPGGDAYVDSWDRGYVSAEGTWIIEGTPQAFPIQITNITCLKLDNYCMSAQALIGSGPIIFIDVNRSEIERWDNNTVVYMDKTSVCVEYVYTINRDSRRVIGSRAPKKDADDLCELLEQQEIKLTLVDGYQVWRELERLATARVLPFMWAAITLCWVIVAYRIVRRRRPNP